MTYSISRLLEGKFYRSTSYARKGQEGIIQYAELRTDCWRTVANDERAYRVLVRPHYVAGMHATIRPDFFATVYVNVGVE